MELNFTALRGGRLSSVLREDMTVSGGLMNRLKWDDRILVNGVPRRTNFQVAAGDTITLLLDEEEPEYPAEDLPLTVLYEDDHILAVDKPAGMLIHPSRSQFTGTLANAVAGYYRRTGQRGAFHPVTRLDRDTYGVVLLAKHSHVHALLQQGRVEKIYEATVFGCPGENEGIIDAPIARRPLPSLLRYVNPDGKSCQTRFQVLADRGDRAHLRLWPLTGRTHQLRVHCAHMGWPILGDPQYGSPESLALSQRLGLSSQMLCAKSVEFSHPLTGEPIIIRSHMDGSI